LTASQSKEWPMTFIAVRCLHCPRSDAVRGIELARRGYSLRSSARRIRSQRWWRSKVLRGRESCRVLTAPSSPSHCYGRTLWLKMARALPGCNPYRSRVTHVLGCHLYEVADAVIEALRSTFMPLFESRRAHEARSHGPESLKPLPGLDVS